MIWRHDDPHVVFYVEIVNVRWHGGGVVENDAHTAGMKWNDSKELVKEGNRKFEGKMSQISE